MSTRYEQECLKNLFIDGGSRQHYWIGQAMECDFLYDDAKSVLSQHMLSVLHSALQDTAEELIKKSKIHAKYRCLV